MSGIFKDLLERRVPQILGLYLAAGWGVLEFTDYIVSRYVLSHHLTDLALMAWGLMIPSVALLAYFHGRPGRDEWSTVEKVGIPINIVLAVGLLIPAFTGKDLGAATREVTVENEAGELVEREVPKSEFRKRIAIFYFENTSADSTLDWLQLGIPLALQDDLLQDMFMVTRAGWPSFSDRLKEAGYPDGIGVPFALRREMAEELHLNHLVSGTIAGSADSLAVTVALHDVARGKLLSEHTFTGSDPFDIVDRISLRLKRDLEVPAGHIEDVRDLPASELLTESVPAFKAFVSGWRGLEADDWQSAARGFAAAVDTDPTYASANLMLFVASMLLNDTESGSRALEAAMQHSYKLTERGRFTLRTAYYRIVKQDPAKTMATAGTHAELFPDDVAAHQTLAQLYRQAGERDKAIEAAVRVLELDPGEYDMLRLIGGLYTEQGAFEQAREYYERYTNTLPEDPRGFGDLGDLSRIVGEHERALEYYDRALVLDPSNTGALSNIARTEAMLGRFESAEQHLEEARDKAATPTQKYEALDAVRGYSERRGQMRQAIDIMQQTWSAIDLAQPPLLAVQLKLLQLGTYVRAGRVDLASAALEDSRRQLSSPLDMLASIGQFIIAEETEDAASLEESLAELERLIAALGLESLRPVVTFGGGRLLEIRGDCEQAIIAYKRAAELQPAGGGLNSEIGRCYRLLGNFEMAESHLLESVALDPYDPMANLELGRVYSESGEDQKARDRLQIALEVWANADPDYEPAREARELLAQLATTS